MGSINSFVIRMRTQRGLWNKRAAGKRSHQTWAVPEILSQQNKEVEGVSKDRLKSTLFAFICWKGQFYKMLRVKEDSHSRSPFAHLPAGRTSRPQSRTVQQGGSRPASEFKNKRWPPPGSLERTFMLQQLAGLTLTTTSRILHRGIPNP